MDKEQIKAAKEKFARIKDINANKIVLRLKKGELVFLVAKDPKDGKFIIAGYKLEVINGRTWVRTWKAEHKEWNGAYIDGQKVMVDVQNSASDLEDWLRQKNEGKVTKYCGGYDYPLRDEFQWTLDGDDGFFPKGCLFWGYAHKGPDAMGNGIEEEFAEYWFNVRKAKDAPA